ncbi:hypothetical protein M0805_001879 [Coniferiporia weirii]|nr:hypothetical protein M0805_001879 [Coniferiporia weirii]
MLKSESYTLISQEGDHYGFSVNRYSLTGDNFRSRSNQLEPTTSDSIILVLAHGVGLHKELWEPFLLDLQSMQSKNPSTRFGTSLVSEAWAVDCPSHGDSGILNEDKLIQLSDFESIIEYSRALTTLMESDFFPHPRSNRIVLVGHSGGTCGIILSASDCMKRWGFSLFHSIILLEPAVLATPSSSVEERSENWRAIGDVLTKLATQRRDKWPSKKEAYEWLRLRQPYSGWDPRALVRYVEHGLRPLPTLFYPEETTGWTLKCHKAFEIIPFSRSDETATSARILEDLHKQVPVHLVFGQDSPFRPIDEDIPLLTSKTGKNSDFASVTDIPNGKHFIVQEEPVASAEAVFNSLNTQGTGSDAVEHRSFL